MAIVDERTGKGYEIRPWPATLRLPDGGTVDDGETSTDQADQVLFRAASRGELPPARGGTIAGIALPDGVLYCARAGRRLARRRAGDLGIDRAGAQGGAAVVTTGSRVRGHGDLAARGRRPVRVQRLPGLPDGLPARAPQGSRGGAAQRLERPGRVRRGLPGRGDRSVRQGVSRLAEPTPGPRATSVDHIVAGLGGHLALVAVHRPADAVDAVGWMGAVNYDGDPLDMSTVLRSWELRFDAYLVGLGTDTMTAGRRSSAEGSRDSDRDRRRALRLLLRQHRPGRRVDRRVRGLARQRVRVALLVGLTRQASLEISGRSPLARRDASGSGSHVSLVAVARGPEPVLLRPEFDRRSAERRDPVARRSPPPRHRPRVERDRIHQGSKHAATDLDVVRRRDDRESLSDQVMARVLGPDRRQVRRRRMRSGQGEELHASGRPTRAHPSASAARRSRALAGCEPGRAPAAPADARRAGAAPAARAGRGRDRGSASGGAPSQSTRPKTTSRPPVSSRSSAAPVPPRVATTEVERRRRGARRVEDPGRREPALAHEVDHGRLRGGHVDLRPDRVVPGDEVAGQDEQPLPVRRQRHATGRPHEQRRPQSRLESLDLATQRLLGDEQACRGAREVELLGRRHEVAQGADLELVADRAAWSIHALLMVIAVSQVLDLRAPATEGW